MVDSARDANAQELFGRKSLAELNAERPLADVFFDLDTPDDSRRREGAAGRERELGEDVGEHHADDRGLLRRLCGR